jgi:peroxiredoxin
MKHNLKAAGLLTAFCIVGVTSWAQNAVVSANIKGLKDKQVKVGYRAGTEYKTDSVKVANGKFTWTAKMAEPQQVYLMFANMYYPFFAQSGNINITGIADSTQSFKVTGSKIQQESEAYESSIKDLSDQEGPLYEKYGKGTKEEQSALEAKLEEIRLKKRGKADQYIAAHPASFFSLNLVSQRASYGSDYSEVKKVYDQLDKTAQATGQGKALAERLDILKRSAIGTDLIDFTQNDTTGTPVRFASFKGKYVLVDFWASWCGPCRGENPNVLKAYNQYKDKNFTVVGISLDEKGDKWKKAIVEDNMPWAELSDLKGWKNEVSTYYGIQGIPSNLLVDPTGKIVARDLRGEALHKKLGELLN